MSLKVIVGAIGELELILLAREERACCPPPPLLCFETRNAFQLASDNLRSKTNDDVDELDRCEEDDATALLGRGRRASEGSAEKKSDPTPMMSRKIPT